MVVIAGMAYLLGASIAIGLLALLLLVLLVYFDTLISLLIALTGVAIILNLYTPVFKKYGMPSMKYETKGWYISLGVALFAFYVAYIGMMPFSILGGVADIPAMFLPITTVAELLLSWAVIIFIGAKVIEKI